MKYQIIHSVIWDDERFRRLSITARYLWLYLLTNPRCNFIGFYILRYGYATEDTQLKDQEFDAAFKELIRQGMISWDKESSLLLIRNFLKYNPLYSSKQMAGVKKTIISLPRSPLISEFLRHVEEPAISSQGNNSLVIGAIKDGMEKKNAEPASPIDMAPPTPDDPRPPERPNLKKEEMELIVTHWNEICGEKLNRVQTITKKREGHIRARLEEHPLPQWPGIFSRVARSGFLNGLNDKNWRADFDWVMNQNNLVKILEGKYDDRTNINKPKTGMEALKAVMEKSYAQRRTVEAEKDAGRDFRAGDGPDPEDVQH